MALILDTSGVQAFIGIANKGLLYSKKIIDNGRHFSTIFLPAIISLLHNEIPDFIALGTGPGSFIGTRSGAITGKTLAYAWRIPLITFSSTLIPDLDQIARLTYNSYLLKEDLSQFPIELVYISSLM